MSNILDIDGYIEVKIPNNYYKFKSEFNLFKHLGREVNILLNKQKTLVGYRLYKATFDWYDNVKINDFNYCCYNKCKLDVNNSTYRFFGFACITIKDNNKNVLSQEVLILKHKTRYGNIKVNIKLSSYSEHSLR
ncbi:hypothetical protein LCGC14_1027050 [marine sediment metagenome]|uniref:Uncharacterized protein n=1 Tax=marine sediment metagenome TaxID=412755 RepID=A0A0F9MVQ2_9ZZZZ